MGYIIKPLVTEKMTAITEKQNKFGFIVRPEANKIEIKKEVEALYNVSVVDVNTMRYAGKNKSRYTKAGLIKGGDIDNAIVIVDKEISCIFLLFACSPAPNGEAVWLLPGRVLRGRYVPGHEPCGPP